MYVLHTKSQNQSFGEQQNSPDRQGILKIASLFLQISPSKLGMWLRSAMPDNRVYGTSLSNQRRKKL